MRAPSIQLGDGDSVSAPPLQSRPDLVFEVCSALDPRREKTRRDHYVPLKGTHGQQVHFLVWYKNKLAGAISGASPVYASGPRDKFFHITKENREKVLNGIIDNVYFRLDIAVPNLATQILAAWRRVVVYIWEDLYTSQVFGFETFADQERGGKKNNRRLGSIYLADNWTDAGDTAGNAKYHGRGGLTGGLTDQPHRRHETQVKYTLCKWVAPHCEPIICEYKSSWRANTAVGTPDEKIRAKALRTKRKYYHGKAVWVWGKRIFIGEMNGETTREQE